MPFSENLKRLNILKMFQFWSKCHFPSIYFPIISCRTALLVVWHFIELVSHWRCVWAIVSHFVFSLALLSLYVAARYLWQEWILSLKFRSFASCVTCWKRKCKSSRHLGFPTLYSVVCQSLILLLYSHTIFSKLVLLCLQLLFMHLLEERMYHILNRLLYKWFTFPF